MAKEQFSEKKEVLVGDYGRIIGPYAAIDYDGMLKKKHTKLRTAMKKYDLGAIIGLTNQNFEYATNIPMTAAGTVIGGNRYVIFPADGVPIAFEQCGLAFHLKHMYSNIRVEYSIPPMGGMCVGSRPEAQEYLLTNFADQIYGYLKELKLHKERIGIDISAPPIQAALEKKKLTITLDGEKAMKEARRLKTSEELDLFRILGSVIDGAFGVMARMARPGITEREIFGACNAYAIEQGITPDGGFIDSGPHTWPKDGNRAASDRRMRPGDVVYADFFNWGCFGYRSCYYRTFSIGSASPEVKAAYKETINLLKAAEKLMVPGKTTKDVCEQWPDEISIWSKRPPYITDEKTLLSTYWDNMGHGLGLSQYEEPFIWRPTSLKWPQTFEAGMVVAIETEAPTPDNYQGIRVEDMVIITEKGNEVVSKWPKDEITELPLF